MDIIFVQVGLINSTYTFTQCCLGSPFVDILKSLLKDIHFKLILKPNYLGFNFQTQCYRKIKS